MADNILDNGSAVEEEFNELDLTTKSMYAGRRVATTQAEQSEGGWLEKIFDLQE